MKMPRVATCDMTECFFNIDETCHALAINVGTDHPACDTFIMGTAHGGVPKALGGVGACKVESCHHNKGFLCSAPDITVGHHGGHADCKTYMAR